MNVCIDCGSNIGQGFEVLKKQLGIDQTWLIFMFEPNERCVKVLKKKYKSPFIINCAVWNAKEKRRLTVEYCEKQKDWIGGSTNIIEPEEYKKPHYIKSEHFKQVEEVNCIDFSEFVRDIFGDGKDRVILKMDIEGAEFPVLDKMIEDGTILLINSIYVEWHNRLLKNKRNIDYYIKYFKKYNIEYHEWY